MLNVLEWGLKENYAYFIEEFKKRIKTDINSSMYFVYNEDDIDMAYVFNTRLELQCFLESMFYRHDCYDKGDLETSLSNWKVWEFVNEEIVKLLEYSYRNAKPSLIKTDDQTVYRKICKITVEPAIYVGVDE